MHASLLFLFRPALVAMALLLNGGAVRAATTIDAADANAYGTSLGWINLRGNLANGAVIGEFICAGSIYSANCGWISLGSGEPANGIRYQNLAPGDYGVNTQDYSSVSGTAEAKLRGYAYGANIGWISFEATGDPRVDLTTGQLKGHAYSANAGWIVLAGIGVTVKTTAIATGLDTDEDTIPDAWERFHAAGDLTLMTTLTDSDGDGVLDKDEYSADTNPFNVAEALRITAFVPPRQLVIAGPFMTDIAWTGKASRWYALETNAELSGEWTTQVNHLPPGPGAATLLSFADSAGVTRFYRIRAKLPLAP